MQFRSFTKKIKPTDGFSLVEVLVSISIFAIVVTISVGTLIVLIDANAKAQSVQAGVNNVAFVLDSMVRDIRTGYAYQCGTLSFDSNPTPSDCVPGKTAFAFTESGDSLTAGKGSNRIGFRLANEAIERRLGLNGSWQVVTAPDVRITALKFVVTGTSLSDNTSPLVTVFITGEAGDIVGTDSTFSLQTTVTQQSLDI